MCSTFGDCHRVIVIDRKEDMGDVRQVRERVLSCQCRAIFSLYIVAYLDRPRVGCLHEHERHGRSEQDNVGMLEVGEVLAFEVSVVSTSVFGLCIRSVLPYSSQNAMTYTMVSLLFFQLMAFLNIHYPSTSHSSAQIYLLGSLCRFQYRFMRGGIETDIEHHSLGEMVISLTQDWSLVALTAEVGIFRGELHSHVR